MSANTPVARAHHSQQNDPSKKKAVNVKIITANYKFEYDWVASCYKLLPFQPVFTKAKTSRHKHRICKIRVRPNARQVVITAGSPSGIAATAKATAILSSNGGDMTHMTLSICKWWEWQ